MQHKYRHDHHWAWSALREKFPYSEIFCSVFSRIRTEYGEKLRIFPYSVQMAGNTDENNPKYFQS